MDKEILREMKSKNYLIKNIKNLLPGEIVLHPIYRQDGLMLINKYKILTGDLISKIYNHIPNNISVLVASSKSHLNEFISKNEHKDYEYIKCLNQIVDEYNEILSYPLSIDSLIEKTNNFTFENEKIITHENSKEVDFHELFYSIPFFSSFEINLESNRLQQRAKSIKLKLIDTILNNKDLYELFTKLKRYKDILLVHSINTTTIALMIGLTLELKDDDLIDLGIAALFSDLGFTEIPKDQFELYLRSREKQDEILIKHIEKFMKISLEIPMLRKESIIYGILDRHEYFNGSGRPHNKKADEISLFGRILSIAQDYDVMVGGYLYSDGIVPTDAINILWDNKDIQYYANILRAFIYRTKFYKLESYIMFNKDRKGKIIGFTNYLDFPNLPIIKTKDGKTIDLMKC